jgi:hypothetical protein
LALAAYLLTALAGSTGMLVTAGFTFNETFLYWFPNFAFAFLLLGGVVLIHLGGAKWVQAAQRGFIAVTLGALLLLTAVALNASGGELPMASGPYPAGHAWAPLLLLFVGIDLVRLDSSVKQEDFQQVMVIAVLSAALFFAFWGWAAVGLVPLQRLAETTIAPVLIAKPAWGQWGRYTMGLVTIAGTLAAVNALFAINAVTIRNTLNKNFSGRRTPDVAIVVILGIATAAAMAFGAAGAEGIDVALRAGMVLWVVHYALVSLQNCTAVSNHPRIAGRILPILTAAMILTGAGCIIFTDPQRALLLIFMLVGISAGMLMTLAGGGPNGKKGV